jgi:hypothetical protein
MLKPERRTASAVPQSSQELFRKQLAQKLQKRPRMTRMVRVILGCLKKAINFRALGCAGARTKNCFKNG